MGTVSVGLMVGLDDLQGLFQPRLFCDSVIVVATWQGSVVRLFLRWEGKWDEVAYFTLRKQTEWQKDHRIV